MKNQNKIYSHSVIADDFDWPDYLSRVSISRLQRTAVVRYLFSFRVLSRKFNFSLKYSVDNIHA